MGLLSKWRKRRYEDRVDREALDRIAAVFAGIEKRAHDQLVGERAQQIIAEHRERRSEPLPKPTEQVPAGDPSSDSGTA